MTDVLLSDADQAALRDLVAAEPVPGTPLPTSATLEALARLIPCDAIGVVLRDATGCVVAEVVSPPGYDQHCPVPDTLTLCVAVNGRHQVELWLDRRSGPFSHRDRALMRILAPALRRLLTPRPSPVLPESLTLQERRVLDLVGRGWSNPEIAERMCIETCTVRKHLEHAYKKLGVGSRHAAIAVLHGANGHVAEDSPIR